MPAYAQKSPQQDLGTALAFAAVASTPEEVKTLLDAGAVPDESFNSAGVSALALAAQRQDESMEPVVKLLLDAGANLEIVDSGGQTPLFYAARAGNAPAVAFLLEGGADMYHVDTAGLTARDAAFREGKKESVAAMDDYVRKRNQGVAEQYEQRAKELEQRNQEYEKRNQELQQQSEALAQQHQQIRDDIEQRRKKEAADKEAARIAAERQRAALQQRAENSQEQKINQKIRPRVDTDKLKDAVHDLSFHACATTYWKFIRSVKQETGMTREELTAQMDAHNALADEAGARLRSEFNAPQNYLERIVNPSIGQILGQLKRPPTNASRKAEGIGTKQDMNDRCTDIADQWEIGQSKPGLGAAGKPRHVVKEE